MMALFLAALSVRRGEKEADNDFLFFSNALK